MSYPKSHHFLLILDSLAAVAEAEALPLVAVVPAEAVPLWVSVCDVFRGRPCI